MIATIDYLERKFDEFNHTIFEGRLKTLPLRLSSARTFLGQLRYRRKRRFWGGWKYDNFQLVISTAKEMNEQFKNEAKSKGYILNAFSYTKKEKKSKGEIIDDGYLVKVAKVYGGFWDGLE